MLRRWWIGKQSPFQIQLKVQNNFFRHCLVSLQIVVGWEIKVKPSQSLLRSSTLWSVFFSPLVSLHSCLEIWLVHLTVCKHCMWSSSTGPFSSRLFNIYLGNPIGWPFKQIVKKIQDSLFTVNVNSFHLPENGRKILVWKVVLKKREKFCLNWNTDFHLKKRQPLLTVIVNLYCALLLTVFLQ